MRRVLGLVTPRTPAVERPRLVDPYKDFIAETLKQYPTLRATRLFDMVKPRGYAGEVRTLRAYVATVRPRPAARGVPARVDAARRAGPGGLGPRRQGARPGRRAASVGLRDGAGLVPRHVGRIRLRPDGALAAALAGARGRLLRRQHAAVALRQPEDGRARAARRRGALPPAAARRSRRTTACRCGCARCASPTRRVASSAPFATCASASSPAERSAASSRATASSSPSSTTSPTRDRTRRCRAARSPTASPRRRRGCCACPRRRWPPTRCCPSPSTRRPSSASTPTTTRCRTSTRSRTRAPSPSPPTTSPCAC